MSNPFDNNDDDLGEFEFVTQADLEDAIFSQLDENGQPIVEPASVALRNDSMRSDMSLERSSEVGMSNNNGANVGSINPSHLHYRLPAHEPQAEMAIEEVRAVLDSFHNPQEEFDVPARGQDLDERAIPLSSLSQESFSGMNADSPAGSQAGVNGYSLPIQFPPSQPSSQSSYVFHEEGLGSLSQEHNRTVPSWTRDDLELPSSQESL